MMRALYRLELAMLAKARFTWIIGALLFAALTWGAINGQRHADEQQATVERVQLHALTKLAQQEADVVLGLYRPRAYEPQTADKPATLRVLKNRQGQRGDIRLTYEGQFVRFETPTAAHYAHPYDARQ